MDQELYAAVLIDRSGSMGAHIGNTISAFNGYVLGLKNEKVDGRLSLTFFDTKSIDLVYHATPIKDVPVLQQHEFRPRGGTPLYDAIGRTIHDIDTRIALIDPTPRVTLVIVTDGMENSSVEYTAPAIKAMIQERENCGWMVMYLGANQNAWHTGDRIGTMRGQTVSYDMQNIGATMNVASTKTSLYASDGTKAEWTDAERDLAKGKEK